MAKQEVMVAEIYPTPKWPRPTEPEPSMDQLGEWHFDGISEATDGCPIEPDGVCNHGYPSWLLYLETQGQ